VERLLKHWEVERPGSRDELISTLWRRKMPGNDQSCKATTADKVTGGAYAPLQRLYAMRETKRTGNKFSEALETIRAGMSRITAFLIFSSAAAFFQFPKTTAPGSRETT